jgi:glycerophosphoryl diester phosphodiesterase
MRAKRHGIVRTRIFQPRVSWYDFPVNAKSLADFSRLIACAVLVTGCVANTLRGVEPMPLPERGICAHRGGATTHPENTLPAYQEAVRLGAHMVELDIAITRDGAIVLMHDATVDRTTDGKGKVIEFTLAELKRLDAGAWKDPRFAGTRVPTFQEALAVLPRNVWINVDFKADARFAGKSVEAAQKVAEILIAENRVSQALFAGRGDDVTAVRAVAPALRICSMERKPDPADYVKAALAQRADFIQLRYCAQDTRLPQWIAELKAAGVRINYFYTNDPAEATRLLGVGVDFVLVDSVASVLSRQRDLVPLVPRW